MAIVNFNVQPAGQSNLRPQKITIESNDSSGAVTAAGFLDPIIAQGFAIFPNDFAFVSYSGGSDIYTVSIGENGVTTLTSLVPASPTYTWSSYIPTYAGFSGIPTTQLANYLQIGKICFIQINMFGTSNADIFSFTLPITPATLSHYPSFQGAVATDNSANIANVSGLISTGEIVLSIAGNSGTWTTSGIKGISTQFFYQTN